MSRPAQRRRGTRNLLFEKSQPPITDAIDRDRQHRERHNHADVDFGDLERPLVRHAVLILATDRRARGRPDFPPSLSSCLCPPQGMTGDRDITTISCPLRGIRDRSLSTFAERSSSDDQSVRPAAVPGRTVLVLRNGMMPIPGHSVGADPVL